MKNKYYLLFILMFAYAIVFAQSQSNLPIVKGTNIQKGDKYLSQSGEHYLLLQQDGNLVVMTSSDQKVWGLNEVFSNYNQISSIQMQDDGNLVARNSSNGFLWSALSANTNPSSQLIVNKSGVLQLVAPKSKILWSSDGILTNNEFIIDYGWTSYRLLDDPKIIIMGSRAVTQKTMNAVKHIYTEITSRFTAEYPKNNFDDYIIYITNGEPWTELKNLSPIGTMWPDEPFAGSGDFLRGGTSPNYLWIDEQMICKTGVKTRNDAFAAGLLPEGDNVVRTYDQVVHEFGHAIAFKFGLESRIEEFYNGGWNPVEQFPWNVQYWFSTPIGDLEDDEEAFMKEIFTERTTFTCPISPFANSLLAIGTLANVGEWNEAEGKWEDKGRMGGWNLKMLTIDANGDIWCVGTEFNVGKWNEAEGKWEDKGRMGGWTLKMLAFDANDDMWCVGTEANVGKWNDAEEKWEDKGRMGGWTLKMLTFDSNGDMWCVGTEGNVGKWNEAEGKWQNKGHMGGWTLKMLTFDSEGDMWCVGTGANVGKWNASEEKWEDKGHMGGWTLDWILPPTE